MCPRNYHKSGLLLNRRGLMRNERRSNPPSRHQCDTLSRRRSRPHSMTSLIGISRSALKEQSPPKTNASKPITCLRSNRPDNWRSAMSTAARSPLSRRIGHLSKQRHQSTNQEKTHAMAQSRTRRTGSTATTTRVSLTPANSCFLLKCPTQTRGRWTLPRNN